MKYVRLLFAVALVFMVCSAFSFKKGKGEKAVYAFGVAASFNGRRTIRDCSAKACKMD